MKTVRLSAVLLVSALAVVTRAQETTEQYIPIGESPGVSDESVKGEVRRVDYSQDMLTVETDGSTRTIRTDSETRYYLDRTDSRRSNELGNMSDCKVGREVEVKLGEDGKADWVKIDVE